MIVVGFGVEIHRPVGHEGGMVWSPLTLYLMCGVANPPTTNTKLNTGRFNFMNAGWCQNDEANVHVDGIIDQHTLGHLHVHDVFSLRVARFARWVLLGSSDLPKVALPTDPPCEGSHILHARGPTSSM